MKPLSILLFIILMSYSEGFTENPPIEGCRKYKRGMYKSFKEFLANEPSIDTSFYVNPETAFTHVGLYDLKYIDSKGKERSRSTVSIWGFSDSVYVYVKRPDRFHIVNINPLYSYFSYTSKFKLPVGGGFTPSGGGGFNYQPGVNIPVKNQVTYVIDMNSGKITLLNKTSLKKILKDDPDLLQRFKKADKKKSKLQRYLQEYIRRNRSK